MYSQGYMHPFAHSSIIRSGQDMVTTRAACGTGLDEEDVHIHDGTLLGHQKGCSHHLQYACALRTSYRVKQVSEEPHDFTRGCKTETRQQEQQCAWWSPWGRGWEEKRAKY